MMHRCIKRTILIMLLALAAFVYLPANDDCAHAYAAQPKVPAWAKGKIVAHAGGGISGTSYTNSKEALIATLDKNIKCVELDFAWTSDHKLVCAHKSTEFIMGRPTEKVFLESKANGVYTHMNAETALKMLYERDKVYLIMDTQEKDGAAVYAEIKRILKAHGKYGYMKRVVPQIYKKSDYKKYRKVYKFKSGIFTLYKIKPLTANKLRSIASFCKERNLVITISKSRFNAKRRSILKEIGVVTAVHTVNSKSIMKKLLKRGACTVYTDFVL